MTKRSVMLDNPFFHAWRRISPRIVPLFAVITAFLMGIPFIILTGGKGEVGLGVSIAGQAYSALIEGSLGIAINDHLSENDISLADEFLTVIYDSSNDSNSPFTYRDLRDIQRKIGRVVPEGEETARRYLFVYDTYATSFESEFGELLQDEALEELVFRLPSINRLTPERITALTPLFEGNEALPGLGWLLDRDELSNREARSLVDSYATYPSLKEELISRDESFADISDEVLLQQATESLEQQSGILWDALLELEEVSCEIITDGIHVHPEMVKLLYQIKGSKNLILITDSIRGAGMPEGSEYEQDGRIVRCLNELARLSDGTLAGSILTMDQALANFRKFTGGSLAELWPCTSLTPARAIQMDKEIGSIKIGKRADLVLLAEPGQVIETIVAGKTVYRSSIGD